MSAKCPICKLNEAMQAYKPFCSKRCADVDLHRWLGGHYAVPAVEPPDDFDAEIDAAIGDTENAHKLH